MSSESDLDPSADPAPDPPLDDVPGQGAFGPWVDSFDHRVDVLLERVRGNQVADRLFTTASHVGEFSMIWHGTSLIRGLARGRRDQVIILAVLIGAESLIVNQGVKRIFKRTRPTTDGDDRLKVRAPVTSSFPSGHASAAAFAATMLTSWDGRRWAPLWYSIAGAVGISRAYVRIHHASDVVGGFATGKVLGIAGRYIARSVLPR